MSQISKFPITKDVYERIIEVFSRCIADLSSDDEIHSFLKEFLTPTERIMLAKRFAIGFLLEKKYSYREISKILRVSTTTISHVALNYDYGENFKKMVKKILEDEKLEKFWNNIGEKVLNILATPTSKSGSWVYLKEELKKHKDKAF